VNENGEIHHHDGKPDRGNTAGVWQQRAQPDVDAANPLLAGQQGVSSQNATADPARQRQRAHRAHQETGDNAGAETFVWDIFLFGAQAKADSGLDDANYQQNVSGLSEFNDLSKPDGCWFSKPAASCGSDDNTFTDVTNAMLLAAVPGVHGGDGGKITVVNKADGS
jgi:secreted PhoX family phosphatase